jgi:ribose-phosphate pyrophosphokinase
MMLVGDVAGRTAILIDDLADTCTTLSRAGKLLKREGATQVIALVTHGIFSGDGIQRLKGKELDKIVVTNSVDQREHKDSLGDKLEVLEVANIFSEVNLDGSVPPS